MTTHTHRHTALSRATIAAAFLLTGLAGTAQVAGATVPMIDTGGSGAGAAGSSMMIEELGLVPTNGGPGSFSMHPELDGPTLVGSGPDREIVADFDSQQTGVLDESERSIALGDLQAGSETASGTLSEADQSAILAAIGGSGQTTVASGTLDEAARSTDLIALAPDGVTTSTAARHGLPY